VVEEIEPYMSLQQSCTEFVVRSAANVALYEAVETNSGMVHFYTICASEFCTRCERFAFLLVVPCSTALQ
jgi:hypothetical protein